MVAKATAKANDSGYCADVLLSVYLVQALKHQIIPVPVTALCPTKETQLGQETRVCHDESMNLFYS